MECLELEEYGTIKNLMEVVNKGVPDFRQRNVIVEYKDGLNGLLHIHATLNNPIQKLDKVERITL